MLELLQNPATFASLAIIVFAIQEVRILRLKQKLDAAKHETDGVRNMVKDLARSVEAQSRKLRMLHRDDERRYIRASGLWPTPQTESREFGDRTRTPPIAHGGIVGRTPQLRVGEVPSSSGDDLALSMMIGGVMATNNSADGRASEAKPSPVIVEVHQSSAPDPTPSSDSSSPAGDSGGGGGGGD